VAALTTALLGLPASQGGEDKAKELFDKMEKKLTTAKTLQVEAEGKIEAGGKEGTVKSKLLLAAGNKLWAEIGVNFDGKDIEFKSISDGTKTRNEGPQGKEEKDTEKDLRENMGVMLSRLGMSGMSFVARGSKDKQKVSEMLKVSDFKLGKREKIKDHEAQAVDYQLTVAKLDDSIKVTVWIDVKTHLPVRRTMTGKGTITEDVRVQLDPKIDDKKFQLPE
jgi:outer membrane lipoprotein-sorting protein